LPIDETYNTVPERIAEFAAQYPEGRLRQVSLEFVRDFGGADWIVYTAAALRSEDDEKPGEGTAWERVPGLTNFTRNSEMQNAETSAWGRAIVATLAADTKRGPISSLEEKQNRTAERDPAQLAAAISAAEKATTKKDLRPLYAAAVALGMDAKKAAEIRKIAEALPEGDETVD
jgi:hypothetical protein